MSTPPPRSLLGDPQALASASAGAARFPEGFAAPLRATGACDEVELERLPAWARSILCHDGHMTAFLERRHGGRVALRAFESRRDGDLYFRRVVLALESTGAAVEHAALLVHLPSLPTEVRAGLLAEREPFGRLLAACGAPRLSRVSAWLSIAPNDAVAEALGLAAPAPRLWGRQVELLDARREPMALIVEALPPGEGE